MSPNNKPKGLRKQISHPSLGFRLVWNDAPKAAGKDAKVRCALHGALCATRSTVVRCMVHRSVRAAQYPRDHTPRLRSRATQSLFAKYEKVKTIGKGSFGTAVLLRHRRTGHMVVSKQVPVQEMTRDDLSKVRYVPHATTQCTV